MKRWTEEEISILIDELSIGTTHEEIGYLLGRTKSSVMHKVQRDGLAKKFKRWDHLTIEDFIELVKTHKIASEFDTNPGLPGYKTVLKWLGLETWKDCLAFCNVEPNPKGRYDWNLPATFYIIECVDLDGTVFRKFGVTQRKLNTRYPTKKYLIVEETLYSTLREAYTQEQIFKTKVKSYKPKTRDFYKEGHGGYTECYISA